MTSAGRSTQRQLAWVLPLAIFTLCVQKSWAGETPSPSDHTDWIDSTFAKIQQADGLTAPQIISDSTFLRRSHLDLLGTIPSVAVTRDFLADKDANKRERLIETLLADRKHAQNLARVWRRALIPPGSPGEQLAVGVEPWLRNQFSANTPYDDMVRSLLSVKSSQNSTTEISALSFYRAAGGNAEGVADAVTRTFLGVRLSCAKCHDHPFADWKQEEFWGVAAFFSGVRNGSVTDVKLTKILATDSDVEYPARFLWAEAPAEIKKNQFPREAFANWLTSGSNPNFAATTVNRV